MINRLLLAGIEGQLNSLFNQGHEEMPLPGSI